MPSSVWSSPTASFAVSPAPARANSPAYAPPSSAAITSARSPIASASAQQMRFGRGEEQSGGRKKRALLANALEAVIAALYLDGGLEAARTFIDRHIMEPALPDLHRALDSGGTFSGAVGDHKSALQEHLQAVGAGQPQYILTAQSGPDHLKRFRVEVRVAEGAESFRALGEAEGTTKKQAQQDAARIALARLLKEEKSARPTAKEVTT